jgi:transposase InsO family protein
VSSITSRSGKLTDNAFIEAFNGRFRSTCLNTHWFHALADAEKMETWLRYYSEDPPEDMRDSNSELRIDRRPAHAKRSEPLV